MRSRGLNTSETRREIVRAAYRVIRKTGLPNLSMRTVAKELRMSPANLYSYFQDKEELILAISVELSTDLGYYLHQVDVNLSPQEHLLEICLTFLHFVQRETIPMPVLLSIIQQITQTQSVEADESVAARELREGTAPILEIFRIALYRYMYSVAIRHSEKLRLDDLIHTLLAVIYGVAATYPQEQTTTALAAARMAIMGLLNELRNESLSSAG